MTKPSELALAETDLQSNRLALEALQAEDLVRQAAHFQRYGRPYFSEGEAAHWAPESAAHYAPAGLLARIGRAKQQCLKSGCFATCQLLRDLERAVEARKSEI